MAKRELTDEERERLKANLARGRETAAANRAIAKASPAKASLAKASLAKASLAPQEPDEAPLVMPSLGIAAPPIVVEDGPESQLQTDPDPLDPFERFLADLDDETRELLTESDGSTPQLRTIYEAEVKRAKDARREVAKKQAIARAARHAKVGAGLITPDDAAAVALRERMQRKVTWTPELPTDPSGNLVDVGYRVDGRILFHGQPVTGTYGEWLSYREQAWRARSHEMDFEGKGLLNAQRRLSTGALVAKLNGSQL
mgnify:CR=1 FL=1